VWPREGGGGDKSVCGRVAAPGHAWGRQGKRERRARAGETDEWGRLMVEPS
jgi:hypothetical protein